LLLSVLILTYNEAPNIRRTLERLTWAKEIIVVDSFSTDETVEMVKQSPQARVVQRKFDTFADQCNFGLEQISTEWVLSLDADYVLSQELIKEISHIAKAESGSQRSEGKEERAERRAQSAERRDFSVSASQDERKAESGKQKAESGKRTSDLRPRTSGSSLAAPCSVDSPNSNLQSPEQPEISASQDFTVSDVSGIPPTSDIRPLASGPLSSSPVVAYSARFRYCINGHPLRASLYPPRVVLYRKDKAHYMNEGHGHRVQIDGPVGTLFGYIDHDDRKPIERWLQEQIRYARIEAEHLLTTPSRQLNLADRIRRKIILAPFLVFFYTLFGKGLILDGWAGFYYVLQRTVAEVLLSLKLIDRKLMHQNREQTTDARGRRTTVRGQRSEDGGETAEEKP